MDDLGAISLIPTLVVFVLAIITHRPIESLISGSIVGLIIVMVVSSSAALPKPRFV